jgi:hypothetical protein
MSCRSAPRRAVLGDAPSSVGALDRVREDVLAVAGAVLQAPEHPHELDVEALDVGVQRRLLARLLDVALELGLRLVVRLLDPCRMDATVLQEPLEREAGDLAPDAVEPGQDHGVGRVVDDEVDAGEMLEGADVAALAADDAALHVVGGELDDGDRGLGGVPRGQPLHHDGEDVAHAPLGVALGLALDLAQPAGGVVAGLVLHLLEEDLLGLRGRQAGRPLELAHLLVLRGAQLRLARLQPLRVVLELGGASVEVAAAVHEPLLQAAHRLATVERVVAVGAGAGRGDVGDERGHGHRRRAARGHGRCPSREQDGGHDECHRHHPRRDHDLHCRSLLDRRTAGTRRSFGPRLASGRPSRARGTGGESADGSRRPPCRESG